jgi:flagellar biogenesis protein FliO
MLKKRLILLGLLLAASIASQLLLRPCLGESTAEKPTLTTDTSTAWNSVNEKAVDNLGGRLTGRFLLMLAFIAAAGFGVWWFLKRMNTPWLGSKNGHLELIETMHLGPRKAVHVIRAGTKQVLLSSGNDGVRYLCDLTANLETPSAEAKP